MDCLSSEHRLIAPATLLIVTLLLILDSSAVGVLHPEEGLPDELAEGDSGSVPKKGHSLKHNLNPNYDPAAHNRMGRRKKINLDKHGGGSGDGIHVGSTTTTTTTTEPDWDYICHVLCGRGEGGLACNCDLLPVG